MRRCKASQYPTVLGTQPHQPILVSIVREGANLLNKYLTHLLTDGPCLLFRQRMAGSVGSQPTFQQLTHAGPGLEERNVGSACWVRNVKISVSDVFFLTLEPRGKMG